MGRLELIRQDLFQLFQYLVVRSSIITSGDISFKFHIIAYLAYNPDCKRWSSKIQHEMSFQLFTERVCDPGGGGC